MSFDIRTLLVAVALVTAFCAGARLLLWRMHPTIPGLGRWALAGTSTVIGFALVLSYGVLHWQSALSLAQMFIIIGLVLGWDGFRRFIGKPPLSSCVLVAVAVMSLLWIAVMHVHYLTEVKALSNAVLVAVISALIARDLLFSVQRHTPAIRVTGCIYAINAVFFSIRAVLGSGNPEFVDPLNPNGVAAIMLLWLLCSIIAITLGIVLMTAERLQADLDHQANHDPLTGALNRRSFGLLSEKEMARALHYQRPLSVLMIDLDQFKQVNDLLGHDFGDQVLCCFVAVANRVLRQDDVFCRFGGEEFVALLPDTTAAEALVVADRLRVSFATESKLLDCAVKQPCSAITISTGVAQLQQGEPFASLLRRADSALYRAKDNGRNCCEVAQ